MLAAISHFLKIKVLRNISTKVCIFTSYFSRFKTPHSFAVNLCRSYARRRWSPAGGPASLLAFVPQTYERSVSMFVGMRSETELRLLCSCILFLYIIKVTARYMDIVKFILIFIFFLSAWHLYINLYDISFRVYKIWYSYCWLTQV